MINKFVKDKIREYLNSEEYESYLYLGIVIIYSTYQNEFVVSRVPDGSFMINQMNIGSTARDKDYLLFSDKNLLVKTVYIDYDGEIT